MDRVSKGNVGSASASVADVDAGHSCGGVSSRDDASAAQPARDGRVADGVRPLPAIDLPEGERFCSECGDGKTSSDPDQYLIDFGCACPTCRGLGHVPDDREYDGPFFNPHLEWGTLHRRYWGGRGA